MKLSLEQKVKSDLKFWPQFWSPYNKFWLDSITIISSWHTPSLSKRPPPYLTSKFLHRYFPCVNAPVSSVSSVVFVNMYTGRYYSLIRWPPPSFLLLALEHELTQDHPLSPLQNASSFGAFWFACTADFNGTGSAKLLFFQKLQQLSWLLTSHVLRNGEIEGDKCMRENLIFEQMLPPYICM